MQIQWFKILVAGTVFCFSCGPRAAEQPAGAEQAAPQPAAMAANACFMNATGGDTVLLRLTEGNGSVTGSLYIHYAGKDINRGILQGVMNNDTLLADYTFMSEGAQSVRQVAFLRRGDTFVEGFGPVADQGGKVVFADKATLDFSRSRVLEPTPCP